MFNKSNIVVLFILMTAIMFITGGVSYAMINNKTEGVKINSITTSGLAFKYTEGKNKIDIKDAMPMTDLQGKNQSNYFEFEVSGITPSDKEIPYYITTRKLNGSNIVDSAIRLYLTKVDANGNEEEIRLANFNILDQYTNDKIDLSNKIEKVLYNSKVPSKTNYIQKYRLRAWISYDLDYTNPQNNGVNFSISVNVYANGNIKKSIIPTSFATDSWETIIGAIKNNDTSVYAPTNQGVNNQVLRPITLTFTDSLTGETREETHYLRVANTTKCINGELSETACGFVVEFADIIDKKNMNTTQTNIGGYPSTDVMFNYVTNTVYNSLPDEVKNIIIDTTVVSSYGPEDNSNFITSKQKLYLLSRQEVFGDNSEMDTSAIATRQLDYYSLNPNSSDRVKKQAWWWWLRSADHSNNQYFSCVSIDGGLNNHYANLAYGVSPAFRIG